MSFDFATTAQTMMPMAMAETSGSTDFAFSTVPPKKWLMITPPAIGRSTISRMEMNIGSSATSTQDLAKR